MGALLLTLLLAGAPASPLDGFEQLLSRYVVPGAGVDYAAWHANEGDRDALDRFLVEMQATEVDALSRDAQLAYWINVYNAVTLDLILDHWPLRSIQDLGDSDRTPWQLPLVAVQGRTLSLDAIENEIIRPSFQEPRIHFALNCAAVGCPPLRAEAFRAESLDAQLEEATRDALGDAAWADLSDCPMRLTRLFDWYAADFEDLRGFLKRHRPDAAAALDDESCQIEFTEYDWAINAAP